MKERAPASSHGMLRFFCSFSLFNYLLYSYNDDDDYDGRGRLLPLPPLFPSLLLPLTMTTWQQRQQDCKTTTKTRLRDNDDNGETARQ